MVPQTLCIIGHVKINVSIVLQTQGRLPTLQVLADACQVSIVVSWVAGGLMKAQLKHRLY
jgi:hypothetical protein